MLRLLACLLLLAAPVVAGCGDEDRIKGDAELALERVDVAADQLKAVFLSAVTISDERKFRIDAAEIQAAEKALEDLRRAGREAEATVRERRVELPAEIVEQIEDYLRFQSGIVSRIETSIGGVLSSRPSGSHRRLDAALEDANQQRSEILKEIVDDAS